nr:hypothetical protein Iba_chr07dCG5480 [Ipomoea batatas]
MVSLLEVATAGCNGFVNLQWRLTEASSPFGKGSGVDKRNTPFRRPLPFGQAAAAADVAAFLVSPASQQQNQARPREACQQGSDYVAAEVWRMFIGTPILFIWEVFGGRRPYLHTITDARSSRDHRLSSFVALASSGVLILNCGGSHRLFAYILLQTRDCATSSILCRHVSDEARFSRVGNGCLLLCVSGELVVTGGSDGLSSFSSSPPLAASPSVTEPVARRRQRISEPSFQPVGFKESTTCDGIGGLRCHRSSRRSSGMVTSSRAAVDGGGALAWFPSSSGDSRRPLLRSAKGAVLTSGTPPSVALFRSAKRQQQQTWRRSSFLRRHNNRTKLGHGKLASRAPPKKTVRGGRTEGSHGAASAAETHRYCRTEERKPSTLPLLFSVVERKVTAGEEKQGVVEELPPATPPPNVAAALPGHREGKMVAHTPRRTSNRGKERLHSPLLRPTIVDDEEQRGRGAPSVLPSTANPQMPSPRRVLAGGGHSLAAVDEGDGGKSVKPLSPPEHSLVIVVGGYVEGGKRDRDDRGGLSMEFPKMETSNSITH